MIESLNLIQKVVPLINIRIDLRDVAFFAVLEESSHSFSLFVDSEIIDRSFKTAG